MTHRIREAQHQVDEAERELREAVRAARADGATWEEIGDALGVKKQTAWERFWRDTRDVDREAARR